MKTNSLGKVKISSSRRNRERFDFTHNVNTTFGFGETQPIALQTLVPGSKAIVSNESLVRLAPMVSPTFGLMKLKTWHYFVAMSDLSRNFVALMAQTKVARGDRVFYPESVPEMTCALLSAQILQGSHCSIWIGSGAHSDDGDSSNFITYDTHTHNNDYQPIIQALESANVLHFVEQTKFDNHQGWKIDVSAVCPFVPLPTAANEEMPIYLQNNTRESFFQRTDDIDQIVNVDSLGFDDSLVYLDSADYVAVRTIGDRTYAFAFRLSSFGKRLRKILQGIGYQINFNDLSKCSLMPIFAYYKAYYDTFGLTLYSNWDTANCARLLEYYDVMNQTNYDPYLIESNDGFNVWFDFLKDLGSCWTTSEQEFVAAHTRSIGVSPNLDLSGRFLDVNGNASTPLIQENPNLSIPNVDGEENEVALNSHAFINRVQHGQLDSELLKRLYKWTNRNTIAGKRIEALLRAQGLGDYVDSCKPRFIGYTEVDIDVSDVVSQSDTYNSASGEGSQLGQYGGRGIGYSESASSKVFEYETDEFGYWITFAAVVPYAGYTQMPNSAVKCIKKLDFYNPEFDGVGMEATPKNFIVGSQNFVSEADDRLDNQTFGFVPKYSSLKVASNCMNGDFNLRSTRSVYVPYTIDKILDVGERYIRNMPNLGTGINGCTVRKIFKPSQLPIAGPNPWRYDTRYAWLGNFNRIFSYKGDSINDDASKVGVIEWFGLVPENFMVHNTYRFIVQAPMLPIADSFETLDDGNDGKSDTSISKA